MTRNEAIAGLIENIKSCGVAEEGYNHPDCDAKTFWEVRCGLLEHTFDQLFKVVYAMAPAGLKEDLDKVWKDYTMMAEIMPEVIDYDGEIREEYKDEPPLDAA